MPSYLATIRQIAEACSHANDDGGDLKARWDEHLHDPSAEGGHKWCGPCVAFRALADEPPPEAISAVRALSPAVVEELRREMRVVAREVAEAQWDRFTGSDAFRGFMDDRANEAVASGMHDQAERLRREMTDLMRTHINKQHVQGVWSP